MEKHKNPFMKSNNLKRNHFKNDIPKNDIPKNNIPKNDIPKNDRWNTIKRDIEDREEREERNNTFRKPYQNQRHHYSKFMQFTKLPEKKPEKKPEFNLEKMQEDFPQLGQ